MDHQGCLIFKIIKINCILHNVTFYRYWNLGKEWCLDQKQLKIHLIPSSEIHFRLGSRIRYKYLFYILRKKLNDGLLIWSWPSDPFEVGHSKIRYEYLCAREYICSGVMNICIKDGHRQRDYVTAPELLWQCLLMEPQLPLYSVYTLYTHFTLCTFYIVYTLCVYCTYFVHCGTVQCTSVFWTTVHSCVNALILWNTSIHFSMSTKGSNCCPVPTLWLH